jgi:hypothetical protein
VFALGTPVAAVSRELERVELFAVGENGGVYTAAVNGTGNDWLRLPLQPPAW